MITPAYSSTATERVLPKLALDFTTGVLDPRVSISRALNTATRVNSSGLIEIVSANLPRFDYNPVTLELKGLLIEESRQNLLTYSEQFNDASWIKAASTISANAIVAPDGTLTADKLVENTVTAAHNVYKSVASLTGTYTYSFYVKAAERSWVYVEPAGTSASRTYFQLSGNGSVGNVGTGVTASIQAVNNGWYRIVWTYTFSAQTAWATIGLATGNGVNNYLGDGVSGVYPWGAQLEAGAFATSYIPTTTTNLTRNADVVQMTGANFSDWYNVGAGSWYIQTNARNAATILTAGLFTLAATATALRKYANSYATDQSATSLVLGQGTVEKVSYYTQALLAAELAALAN